VAASVAGYPSILKGGEDRSFTYDAPTTIVCRRRPRRRPRGTLLTLYFDVDNFDVLWFCPACDDNGRISGWQGTFWDNSDLPDTATEQVS
jgi:hypothetical protein